MGWGGWLRSREPLTVLKHEHRDACRQESRPGGLKCTFLELDPELPQPWQQPAPRRATFPESATLPHRQAATPAAGPPHPRRPGPSPAWPPASPRRSSPRRHPPARTHRGPGRVSRPRTAAPGAASSCRPEGGEGGRLLGLQSSSRLVHAARRPLVRCSPRRGATAGARCQPACAAQAGGRHGAVRATAAAPHLKRSSSFSVCSTERVAASRRSSSMKGSSATPCQAKRLPFMSTLKSLG